MSNLTKIIAISKVLANKDINCLTAIDRILDVISFSKELNCDEKCKYILIANLKNALMSITPETNNFYDYVENAKLDIEAFLRKI